jgi:GntP family gluconate:H+ symporter
LLSVLSVMHGLTPPHPGPVVAIEALGANTGKVLMLSILIGLPIGVLTGPVFARWISPRVLVQVPALSTAVAADHPVPGFKTTIFIVVLPIALMMLSTAAELVFRPGNIVRTTLAFTGHPSFALAFGVILAAAVFRKVCRFSRAQILQFTEQSVAGIGMTLLVVGAGGGFARVLKEAGVSTALGELASSLHLPPLLYGWLLAAFIRVATGSATVAITAAAGVLVPFAQASPALDRELLVISIGCGSLFLSHLNDGGFWIVKDSLGLTVGETLRTWTVVECLIGVLGLAAVFLLDFIL